MNIKNEEELSNILGMAFVQYANRVARGEVAPYKAFIDGAETVTVQVSLAKGVLQVTNPFVEPLLVEQAVEEASVEVPVLEAQAQDEQGIFVPTEDFTIKSDGHWEDVKEEKPKSRKRKA
jgi:hypothetical protein